MGKKDPRVDAYIAKAAPFAKPILTQIRAVMHAASPEIDEDMKWSMPHFMYRGLFAGMAAFKAHAALGFWKGALIVDKAGQSAEAMGQFGRLTSAKDLPSKAVLTGYVKQAMKLRDERVPSPSRTKRKPLPAIPVPKDFSAALKTNKKAKAAFDAFSPGAQRDYLAWVTEAKTDTTRAKRLATSIEWIAEGKRRNWKYEAK